MGSVIIFLLIAVLSFLATDWFRHRRAVRRLEVEVASLKRLCEHYGWTTSSSSGRCANERSGRQAALQGHDPVPCDNGTDWAMWFESADRHVAITVVGRYLVSTVFLGIDHSYGQEPRPLLFETMVFEGDSHTDLDCERCSTWAEAEQQHRRLLAKWTALVN